jgi:hypothetical protein
MAMTRRLLTATVILCVSGIAVAADLKVIPGSYCASTGKYSLRSAASGNVISPLQLDSWAVCALLRDVPGSSKLPLVEVSLKYFTNSKPRHCQYGYQSATSSAGGFVLKTVFPGERGTGWMTVRFTNVDAIPNGLVTANCFLTAGDSLFTVRYSE